MGGSEFLSRVKRDDCQAIQTAHGECTQKAYADYQAEWAAGDDGRPDWVAGKTCNYLTGSIEDCGNKLVESGCVSQEEVDRMKDNQMAASLQQVKDNVQSWDSTKCPPVKSYLQRVGLLPTRTTRRCLRRVRMGGPTGWLGRLATTSLAPSMFAAMGLLKVPPSQDVHAEYWA